MVLVEFERENRMIHAVDDVLAVALQPVFCAADVGEDVLMIDVDDHDHVETIGVASVVDGQLA